MYSTFFGVRWYSVQIWPWVPRMCAACSGVSAAGTGSNA